MTNEQREHILSLCDDFTAEQISQKTGCTRQEIDAFLRRNNITPITNADLIRHRLYKEAPYKSREQMFKDLGITAVPFEKYVLETGVVFESAKEKEYKPRISFWDRLRGIGVQQGIREKI